LTEHLGLIMFLWAVLTIVFGSGVSWATVKITLRGVQKDIAERDERSRKRDRLIEQLQTRIATDEQEYVKTSECDKNRTGCRNEHAYHESVIMKRLDELKNGIDSVIVEQKSVRTELYERLDNINKELHSRRGN
jgi:hypothetical protein